MPSLDDSLLSTAKIDFEASKALTKQRFFAHSLFYLEQAFEESIKSLLAYYRMNHDHKTDDDVEKELRTIFGHDNRKPTSTIIKIIFDAIPSSRKKQFELIMGEPTKTIEEAMERLRIEPIDREMLIKHYRNSIEQLNEVKNETFRTTTDITTKFIALAYALSLALESIDATARYPLKQYNYQNIEFLNDPSNEMACTYLLDMMYDFLDIVPLMKGVIVP